MAASPGTELASTAGVQSQNTAFMVRQLTTKVAAVYKKRDSSWDVLVQRK